MPLKSFKMHTNPPLYNQSRIIKFKAKPQASHQQQNKQTLNHIKNSVIKIQNWVMIIANNKIEGLTRPICDTNQNFPSLALLPQFFLGKQTGN